MKYKTGLLAAFLLLVPFIYLAAIWRSLPPTLPIHFNFSGTADRYGNKAGVLAMIALLGFINLVVYVLLANLHRLSKKAPVENKERMQKIALAVLIFLTGVQCWVLYIIQEKELFVSIKFLLTGVFLLFAAIGNYMPNLKPNYFAGFRLPWTLGNADNWRRTHQVAGRTWFAGGLLCAFICLLLPLEGALLVSGILFLTMLLLPAFYSYRLFKQAKE